MYNKVLGDDINYTHDSYKRRDNQSETIDDALAEAAMGYHDYVHNRESGALLKANKPRILPKGRVINLDFDINNGNNIKAALVDLNTAGATKQLQGFLASEEFSDMLSGENKKLVEGRIKRYILNKKVGDISGERTESGQLTKKVYNAATIVTGKHVRKLFGC